MSNPEGEYIIIELFTQARAVMGDKAKACRIVAEEVGFEGPSDKLPKLALISVNEETPGALQLVLNHPLYRIEDVLNFRLAKDGYEPDLPPAS